jgi:hypothetical protein
MVETVLTDFVRLSCLLLEVVGHLESDLARIVFEYIVPQISHYVENPESKSEAMMSRFNENAFYLNDQLYYVERDQAIPVSSHTCATALGEAYGMVRVDHATGEIYLYDKDLFRWENECWTKLISNDDFFVEDEVDILAMSIHDREVYTLTTDHEHVLRVRLFNEKGKIKSTLVEYRRPVFAYEFARGQLFVYGMPGQYKYIISGAIPKSMRLKNSTSLKFSGSCEADFVIDRDNKCVDGVYNPTNKIIYPFQSHCPLPCIFDNQLRVHSLGKGGKLFVPVFQHGDTPLAFPLIEE